MGKGPVYEKLVKAKAITGIAGILFVAILAFCPIIAGDQVNTVEVKEKLNALSEGIKHAEFDLEAFGKLAKDNNYDLKGDLMFKRAKDEMKSAEINLKEGEEEFKKALSLLGKGKIEEAKKHLAWTEDYVEKGLEDVERTNFSLNKALKNFASEKLPEATEEDLNNFVPQATETIEEAGEHIDSIKYVEILPFLSLKEVEKELDYSRNTLEKASKNPEYTLGCAYALLGRTEAGMAREEASKVAGAFRNFFIILGAVPFALAVGIDEIRSLLKWGRHGKLISWILGIFEKVFGEIKME